MDKRYQVFVSSTYADLKDERQKVIQTLMQLDCIPAGMELFPAADLEQFEFIKKVIDDCDYYIIIIGGRYGSVTAEGVSYTELEFDYAVSKEMKVIAFIHADPDSIPVGKSDIDPVARQRLQDFCEKVKTGRLVNFWSNATELPGLVALSLPKTIKMFPAIGWVRANAIASTEVLGDINNLRKENERLRKSVVAPRLDFGDVQLADIDEPFIITGTCTYNQGRQSTTWSQSMTWRSMFSVVAPLMVSYVNGATIQDELAKAAFASNQWKSLGGSSPHMDKQVFLTIGVQFKALGLVRVDHLKTTQGGMGDFWKLTPTGEQLMLQERVIRTKRNDQAVIEGSSEDEQPA